MTPALFAAKAVRRAVLPYVPAAAYLPLLYKTTAWDGSLEPELAQLADYLAISGNDCAIDIGANLGLWSYQLSKTCKRVVSFEANSALLTYLNAYQKTQTRCEMSIHSVALSDKAGEVWARIGGLGICQPGSFRRSRFATRNDGGDTHIRQL